MKRICIGKLYILVLLSLVFGGIRVAAQRAQPNINQVTIMGWTDDTHYLIRSFDAEKNPVTKSVDIKTGKSTIVPPSKSERELLSESLPSGVKIGMNDVISPDMKSVIIIKENDLFYRCNSAKN